MTIDGSTVTQAIAAIGIIAGTAYTTIPLLLWHKKLNLDTLHTVSTVSQQVVAGIEQTQAAASSDTKKTLALDAIKGILTSLGVRVPEPYIDMAVEAAVLFLHRAPAPVAPIPAAPARAPAPQPVPTHQPP